jgi:glutathione S-transferase
MRLYFSPASPFVRKVLVCAHEHGLAGKIENLPSAAHPVDTDNTLAGDNPLGQVPTFLTDDGHALYDSRVICEYIDVLGGGGLFPTGAARWPALVRQSEADGLLDAALLARYEGAVRPAEFRWAAWTDGQMRKITRSLDHFEANIAAIDGTVDIGTISVGCALGYIDFRFADLGWRPARPKLADWYARFGERPSMAATRPPAA